MLQAFSPARDTVAVTVGTASANAQLPLREPSGLSQGTVEVRLLNVGTNVVFVAWATGAPPTAVAPVSGTPQNSIPLLPNSSEVFLLPDGAYLAAIAAATGNTLYASVGQGALH